MTSVPAHQVEVALGITRIIYSIAVLYPTVPLYHPGDINSATEYAYVHDRQSFTTVLFEMIRRSKLLDISTPIQVQDLLGTNSLFKTFKLGPRGNASKIIRQLFDTIAGVLTRIVQQHSGTQPESGPILGKDDIDTILIEYQLLPNKKVERVDPGEIRQWIETKSRDFLHQYVADKSYAL